jgi:hypothetical protein
VLWEAESNGFCKQRTLASLLEVARRRCPAAYQYGEHKWIMDKEKMLVVLKQWSVILMMPDGGNAYCRPLKEITTHHSRHLAGRS